VTVLERPELTWGFPPACCWLQFSSGQSWTKSLGILGKRQPRRCVFTEQKPSPVTEQFWSSTFQGQDRDTQQHGKCCILAARGIFVLGFTGSSAYGAVALAASSLPAQYPGGVFQENLKPNYPFRRLFPLLPAPCKLDSGQGVVCDK